MLIVSSLSLSDLAVAHRRRPRRRRQKDSQCAFLTTALPPVASESPARRLKLVYNVVFRATGGSRCPI